jgi:hypothetical protein
VSIKDVFWDFVPCTSSSRPSREISSLPSGFLKLIIFRSYITLETRVLVAVRKCKKRGFHFFRPALTKKLFYGDSWDPVIPLGILGSFRLTAGSWAKHARGTLANAARVSSAAFHNLSIRQLEHARWCSAYAALEQTGRRIKACLLFYLKPGGTTAEALWFWVILHYSIMLFRSNLFPPYPSPSDFCTISHLRGQYLSPDAYIVCICVPVSLLGNGSLKTLPRQSKQASKNGSI